MYFTIKTPGTSSKYASFWRGPYTILSKLSDGLYRINCGRNKTIQVIHCDRMRICRSQLLLGENIPYTSNISDRESILEQENNDVEYGESYNEIGKICKRP